MNTGGDPRYARWAERLAAIAAAGRWRAVRALTPTGATTAVRDGRPIIVACSNDYLGLAWDDAVRAAAHGGGSGGSRLISGSRPVHHALEDALLARFGRPALVFPSGYQANLAVFSTVCGAGELVASDATNHASMIDGLRLSAARRAVVPHATPGAIPADAQLVAVEGLFSMDGDVPPLRDYPRGPWLAVDEAHAVGCLGPEGTGCAAMLGVVPDILIGTFGKAYGAAGAFVIGPPELRDLLINAGRSFIFTTATPEPVAAMALAGLRRADDALRARLAENTLRFRAGLRQLGWNPLGDHHIVPIVVGDRAVALAETLLERGVYAPAIRWPTVAAGQERIRFTVSAAHTAEQLDRVLDALGEPA